MPMISEVDPMGTACVCAVTMNQKSCHTTLSDTVYKVSYRIFFMGGGSVNECNGCMRASAHPQGFVNFMKFWTYSMTKKHQIQL